MRIRWRVREIAEPERWNAKKLAESTGLAYGTVYAIWTNQATRADLKTIEALARVLNVRPGDLLTWDAEEPEERLSPALAAASQTPPAPGMPRKAGGLYDEQASSTLRTGKLKEANRRV